jgi:hypothetical protein
VELQRNPPWIPLEIAGNGRNFANYCSETGPEKVHRSMQKVSFAGFFSGGRRSSPVFADSLRRMQCDQNSMGGKGDLTFDKFNTVKTS